MNKMIDDRKINGITVKYAQNNVGDADCGYVIVFQDGEYKLIITDFGEAGKESNFTQLKEDIEKYGIKKYSRLYTHGDNDHTGGTKKFMEMFPELKLEKTGLPTVYFRCYESLKILESNDIDLFYAENKEEALQKLAYAYVYSEINDDQKAQDKIENLLEQYNKFSQNPITKKEFKQTLNILKNTEGIIEAFEFTIKNKNKFDSGKIVEAREIFELYGLKISAENFIPDNFVNVMKEYDPKSLYNFFNLNRKDEEIKRNENGEILKTQDNLDISEGKQISHYLTKEGGAYQWFLNSFGLDWDSKNKRIKLSAINLKYNEKQEIIFPKNIPTKIRNVIKKYNEDKNTILKILNEEKKKEALKDLNKNFVKDMSSCLNEPSTIINVLCSYSYKSMQNFYNVIYNIEDANGFKILNQGDCELLHEIQMVIEYRQAQEDKNEEKIKEIENQILATVVKDGHHDKPTSNIPSFLSLQKEICNKYGINPLHIGSAGTTDKTYNTENFLSKEECCNLLDLENTITGNNGILFEKQVSVEKDEFGCIKLRDEKIYKNLHNQAKTKEDRYFMSDQEYNGIDLILYLKKENFDEYKKSCLIKEIIKEKLKQNWENLLVWKNEIPNLKQSILLNKEFEIKEEYSETMKSDINTYNSLKEERNLYTKGIPKELIKYQEKVQSQEKTR